MMISENLPTGPCIQSLICCSKSVPNYHLCCTSGRKLKYSILLYRRDLRHLEQAPPGLLRGGAGPEDDRRGEHPLGRGQGAGSQARPLGEHRRAAPS
jgi:hypothetical protein